MEQQYFDQLETMTPEARLSYQQEKLAQAMTRSYEQSATGRELFERAGVMPADIKTVADLAKLPITRKGDVIELEKARPYGGFLALPLNEVDRVFITPGPIYEPLQTESISWFGRAFWAAGFRKGDVVVNTFSYHLSPGGLLFHEGIRRCGATTVPVGVGNTEILIRTMFDLKATGFVGTPSYLLSVIKPGSPARCCRHP
jgi:phenylacetate-CoA ligase